MTDALDFEIFPAEQLAELKVLLAELEAKQRNAGFIASLSLTETQVDVYRKQIEKIRIGLERTALAVNPLLDQARRIERDLRRSRRAAKSRRIAA